MTDAEPSGSNGGADPELIHEFEVFYETTHNKTFDIACRAARGDTQVAHDATQEAYTVMLNRWLEGRKTEGDPGHYVVGIAVRKVADCYRARKRQVPLDEEHDSGVDEARYAAVLDTMTILRAVRDFLDQQPQRRREVGALYFLAEFDYAEIAVTLGMSRSTVRTHVERLRNGLQPLVEGITLDGGGGERQ